MFRRLKLPRWIFGREQRERLISENSPENSGNTAAKNFRDRVPNVPSRVFQASRIIAWKIRWWIVVVCLFNDRSVNNGSWMIKKNLALRLPEILRGSSRNFAKRRCVSWKFIPQSFVPVFHFTNESYLRDISHVIYFPSIFTSNRRFFNIKILIRLYLCIQKNRLWNFIYRTFILAKEKYIDPP